MKKLLQMILMFLLPLASWGALTVNNGGGATNITSTSAWITATIVSTGAANPYLFSYWGATDGGTSAAAWTHTNAYGVSTQAAYSVQITGLAASSVYYFRTQATNDSASAWASYSSMLFTKTVGTTAPPSSVQNVTVDTNDVLKHPTNFFGANAALIVSALSSYGFLTNNTGDWLGTWFGLTTNGIVQTNDSRLTDARTPTVHNQSLSTITNAGTMAGESTNDYYPSSNPSNYVDKSVTNELDDVVATKANTNDLTAHTTNTANPHAVTAAQVGAVPTNDAKYLAALTNGAPGTSTNMSDYNNDAGFLTTSPGVTNQIMDVNGVIWTITNAPPASGKYVWQFDPANSTVWFVAESTNTSADISGWSGTLATQQIVWAETVIASNVVATNLIVSGTLNLNVTGTYVQIEDELGLPQWQNLQAGSSGYKIVTYEGTSNDWMLVSLPPAEPDYYWRQQNVIGPSGTNFQPVNGASGIASVVYAYVYDSTTNTVFWKAGYNDSNSMWQIERDGVVLDSWYLGKPAVQSGTYPVFKLDVGIVDGSKTDFEFKATTNNFATLVYYYKSWTNQPGTNADTNAYCLFTDDYAVDVRKWILKSNGIPISAHLASSNSVVGYVYFYPSHDCTWSNWMYATNVHLKCSWVRVDDLGFEMNFDGSKQRWNAVRPESWEVERTVP